MPGMVELLKLSAYLASEMSCRAIATYLLADHPGGGIAFIQGKQASGAVTNWKLMAHDILMEWCKTKPRQATIEKLRQVLTMEPETKLAAEQVDALFNLPRDGDHGDKAF